MVGGPFHPFALGALLLISTLGLVETPARAFDLAITVDDLPSHGPIPAGTSRRQITRDLALALKTSGAPEVFGFVNGSLATDPDSLGALAEWRAAGFRFGNHTWSHVDLNDVSLAAFENEIERNEPLLRKYSRADNWGWLRLPYLRDGAGTAKGKGLRAYLDRRSYRIASVTLSFDDYAWNEPYERCVGQGNRAGIISLESSYLRAADVSLARALGMSRRLYGREIPLVLLLHNGAFDARIAPPLLELLRKKGARFVTLEKATQDRFYRGDLSPASASHVADLDSAFADQGLRPPARTWSLASLDRVCR